MEQHLFEGETVCVPYVVQGRRQLLRSGGGGGGGGGGSLASKIEFVRAKFTYLDTSKLWFLHV